MSIRVRLATLSTVAFLWTRRSRLNCANWAFKNSSRVALVSVNQFLRNDLGEGGGGEVNLFLCLAFLSAPPSPALISKRRGGALVRLCHRKDRIPPLQLCTAATAGSPGDSPV